MANADTHRVILAIRKGPGDFTYHLVASGLDWHAAQELWNRLDEARLEKRLPFDGYLAVRADNDPDPRWANAKRVPQWLVNALPGQTVKDSTTLGKKIARILGYEGRSGGWIYKNGKPLFQGYSVLGGRHLGSLVRSSGKSGYRIESLPAQWVSSL